MGEDSRREGGREGGAERARRKVEMLPGGPKQETDDIYIYIYNMSRRRRSREV